MEVPTSEYLFYRKYLLEAEDMKIVREMSTIKIHSIMKLTKFEILGK